MLFRAVSQHLIAPVLPPHALMGENLAGGGLPEALCPRKEHLDEVWYGARKQMETALESLGLAGHPQCFVFQFGCHLS